MYTAHQLSACTLLLSGLPLHPYVFWTANTWNGCHQDSGVGQQMDNHLLQEYIYTVFYILI